MKAVAGTLKLELAQFRAMADFAQFASDLDAASRRQLERGARLTELLKQGQYKPIPVERQIVVIYAGTKGYVDTLPVSSLGRYEEELLAFLDASHTDLLDTIRTKKAIDDETGKKLAAALEAFGKKFVADAKLTPMASLKAIRKRIGTVKSTQKITRAMKMVAGARLARAQQRIVALRPYAVKTQEVLAAVLAAQASADEEDRGVQAPARPAGAKARAPHALPAAHQRSRPLRLVQHEPYQGRRAQLARRRRRRQRAVVLRRRPQGQRLPAPPQRARRAQLPRRLESIDLAQAGVIAQTLLAPFRAGEVDSIKIIYNQFRSAMSQTLVVEQLLPVVAKPAGPDDASQGESLAPTEYLYEPDPAALLDRLVPMYLETTILRALYESQASEFGARMTAMDSATKNAKEMISTLTLQYNRARQAAITKELMEIIGGAEALKE